MTTKEKINGLFRQCNCKNLWRYCYIIILYIVFFTPLPCNILACLSAVDQCTQTPSSRRHLSPPPHSALQWRSLAELSLSSLQEEGRGGGELEGHMSLFLRFFTRKRLQKVLIIMPKTFCGLFIAKPKKSPF